MRRESRGPCAGRIIAVLALLCVGAASGCGSSFDPPSLLLDTRLLAVRSEPPSLGPGETATLRALYYPSAGVSLTWEVCTLPPVPGGGNVNLDCVRDTDGGSHLIPIGSGDSARFTMPPLPAALTMYEDQNGGTYLPIRLSSEGPGEGGVTKTDVGVYRLLYDTPGSTQPRNQNPSLTSIRYAMNAGTDGIDETISPCVDDALENSYGAPLGGVVVDAADGGMLDDASVGEGAPLPITEMDRVSLVPVLAPGSAETVPSTSDGGSSCEGLEILWYATAGFFATEGTGPHQMQVFSLSPNAPDMKMGKTKSNPHLPPPGTVIDLYAVVHDGRGGDDWLHRSFVYQP